MLKSESFCESVSPAGVTVALRATAAKLSVRGK